jgi:hypothetical protein
MIRVEFQSKQKMNPAFLISLSLPLIGYLIQQTIQQLLSQVVKTLNFQRIQFYAQNEKFFFWAANVLIINFHECQKIEQLNTFES